MSIGIFIMCAGEGSRLPYDIGKIIPKCMLPVSLVDESYTGPDLIISRIVKLLNTAAEGKTCEINIMVSNTDPLIAGFLKNLSENVSVNVIEGHESSINTLKYCDKIIKAGNYQSCMFINGDMFISDTEIVSKSMKEVLDSVDVCLVENHRTFKYLWSSVVCDNNNKFLSIYPDYVFTTNNLCDVTYFCRQTYEKIINEIDAGFYHHWWEMTFIKMINNNELELHAVLVFNPGEQALLSNINNINRNLTKTQVYDELKRKISFLEEKLND
ncbi:MAG: hypothetical protein FWD38_01075 [Oscillospiraceae bacterium]|nr:hypothetical protein [Oscillospiraceae bacterium]